MRIKADEQKVLEGLWKKYESTKAVEDRDALIVRYLFLVKFVVSRLAVGLPAHIKLEDLYSSGVTGLIKAVERFDPSKNNKFETYAIFLIRGAIFDEMRELDWIPRSIHQKAHRLAAAQQLLQQQLGRDPTDEELSAHLGISQNDLEDILTEVRPAIFIPLNAPNPQMEEASSISERIPDQKAETSYEIADRKEFSGLLEKAIADLPEQERKVLVLYYYEELMLKEIGKVLGVSESRVSQIHTKAILKLRGRLQALSSHL